MPRPSGSQGKQATNWHSKAVAGAVVLDLADGGMLLAAKAMAVAAIDLLASPATLQQAKQGDEGLKGQTGRSICATGSKTDWPKGSAS